MRVKMATRMVAFAMVVAAVSVLAMAQPAAASSRYWGTGAGDYYLPLGPYCGGSTTYPANTPLVIAHGWYDVPWTEEPLKGAFMAPTTTFVLVIDGEVQKSVQSFRYVPEVDTMFKWFYSEYDEGLTGTHVFLGLWFLDGALLGGTPREAVLFGVCEVTIAFA